MSNKKQLFDENLELMKKMVKKCKRLSYEDVAHVTTNDLINL